MTALTLLFVAFCFLIIGFFVAELNREKIKEKVGTTLMVVMAIVIFLILSTTIISNFLPKQEETIILEETPIIIPEDGIIQDEKIVFYIEEGTNFRPVTERYNDNVLYNDEATEAKRITYKQERVLTLWEKIFGLPDIDDLFAASKKVIYILPSNYMQ